MTWWPRFCYPPEIDTIIPRPFCSPDSQWVPNFLLPLHPCCQPQSPHTFEGNRVAYVTLRTTHCVCISRSWHPLYIFFSAHLHIEWGISSQSGWGSPMNISTIQWDVTTISQKEVYIPALGGDILTQLCPSFFMYFKILFTYWLFLCFYY